MKIRNFILATAGHVDHGKSALIQALTGNNPDRLPEEKRRGITIDLGFDRLDIHSAHHPDTLLRLGIIDVPGHEDFVKNMVAGVGSIDLALLVVAADDGWMPQTEEHLQILTYLGVARGVVALTKSDLAPTRLPSIIQQVRNRLAGTPLAGSPIVPTSAPSAHGLQELRTALSEVLDETPAPRDLAQPRLFVDRAFSLVGIGTVTTGTLSGGPLTRGQTVVIQPSGFSTRIRSLQSHGEELSCCLPGTRAALNLPDLQVLARDQPDPRGVRRGMVVTLPELGSATRTWHVLLVRTARSFGEASRRALRSGLRVRLHHGSGNTAARVELLDQKELLPGFRALAQITLEAPVFAWTGDRFILRDWAQQTTLAGGQVLETGAGSIRRPGQREFLEQRASAPRDPVAWVTSRLQRDGVVPRRGWPLHADFPQAEIQQTLTHLEETSQARNLGEWTVSLPWLQARLDRVAAAIDAEHETHPEHLGLPIAQVRASLTHELPHPDLAAPLIQALLQSDFAHTDGFIKRASHRPALPPHLSAAAERLRRSLSAKPFEPPSRKELAPDTTTQQVLRFLRDSGEIVELNPDVILNRASLIRIRQKLVSYLRLRQSATASELRQHIGTTRRILMPVLERLDKEGWTKREGDLRVLGPKAHTN